MDLGIAGKVAFVSGGSKGAGRATAELLAREGCRVVIAARGQEAIDATVETIRKNGGAAAGISADLTTQEGVKKAIDFACQSFGSPDIAIANVHGPGPGNFFDLTDGDFDGAFREMTLSLVYLCQAVIPHMRTRRWGRIVCIGSYAAKEPPGDLKHILANTVRASTVTLNKSLANEFGPDGITVNTIGTGYIGTERMYEYIDKVAAENKLTRDDMLAQIAKTVPVGRPGKPEEMAATIAFLCSELAGYVTGNLIPVDGGTHRSAW